MIQVTASASEKRSCSDDANGSATTGSPGCSPFLAHLPSRPAPPGVGLVATRLLAATLLAGCGTGPTRGARGPAHIRRGQRDLGGLRPHPTRLASRSPAPRSRANGRCPAATTPTPATARWTRSPPRTSKNLAVAWTFSTGVLRGHEGEPLVVDNTMYVVTPLPEHRLRHRSRAPGGAAQVEVSPPTDPRRARRWPAATW